MKSLSEIRESVLRVVERSDTPINVRTIADHLAPRPNLSTIYRALDHLEKREFVQSVAFFDGTRFYYAGGRDAHFILCGECHEIRKFEQCTAHTIRENLEREFDYHLTGHVLYFRGVCADCRMVLDKKARFR